MNEWEGLAEKKIVVTGATGFIGRALVETLAVPRTSNSPPVVALCRNPERGAGLFAHFGGRVEIARWDMAEPLEYAGRADAVVHAVVHAAAHADPADFTSRPAVTMRENLLGCVHILDYAVRAETRRFVFVSSTDVYGVLPGSHRVAETDFGAIDAASPRSCYPLAKLAGENLALASGRQYGFDACVARLSHTYGPGSRRDDMRVSANFPMMAAEGRDIIMKSAGLQLRSFSYIDDTVAGILTLLDRGAGGEIYNVAAEESEITIRRFAELLAAAAGTGVAFAEPSEAERQTFSAMSRSVFATDKLRALGWRPRVGLEEGIRRTLDYFGAGAGRRA